MFFFLLLNLTFIMNIFNSGNVTPKEKNLFYIVYYKLKFRKWRVFIYFNLVLKNFFFFF